MRSEELSFHGEGVLLFAETESSRVMGAWSDQVINPIEAKDTRCS